jgi:hypothetical protein
MVFPSTKRFMRNAGISMSNESIVFVFPKAHAVVQCLCVDRIPKHGPYGHDEGEIFVFSRVPVTDPKKWQYAAARQESGHRGDSLKRVMDRHVGGAYSATAYPFIVSAMEDAAPSDMNEYRGLPQVDPYKYPVLKIVSTGAVATEV